VRRVYRWALRIGKLVGGLSVVVAALWAALQFYKSNIDDHIKTTLTMYERYNSQPFTTYRETLSTFTIDNRDQILAAAKSGNEKNYSDTIMSLMGKKTTGGKNETMKSFDLLTDFFDGIDECIHARLCDWNASVRLFQPRAKELYDGFYPYIKNVRDVNKLESYASGLDRVAHLKEHEDNWVERQLSRMY
jgi:hypothetical protein